MLSVDLYSSPFSSVNSITLVVDDNGNLWGSPFFNKEPYKLDNVPKVEKVFALGHYHYAIDVNNHVWQNILKQPEQVKSLPEIKFIALGDAAYFLDFDGNVWTISNPGSAIEKMQGLPPGIQYIATASRHALFLDGNGVVWVYGKNNSFQLGLRRQGVYTPVALQLPTITMLATSTTHSLFLDVSGNVYATGSNIDGQLGMWEVQYNVRAENPKKIDYLPPIQRIAAGEKYSLFVDHSNRLWGTGKNSSGQLCDNSRKSVCYPQLTNTDVIAVETRGTSFVMKSDGTILMTGAHTQQNGEYLHQVDCCSFTPSLPVRGRKLKSARKVVSNN